MGRTGREFPLVDGAGRARSFPPHAVGPARVDTRLATAAPAIGRSTLCQRVRNPLAQERRISACNAGFPLPDGAIAIGISTPRTEACDAVEAWSFDTPAKNFVLAPARTGTTKMKARDVSPQALRFAKGRAEGTAVVIDVAAVEVR